MGRLFAAKLGERMGQPFVVENRPGAGTMIGTEVAAKSPRAVGTRDALATKMRTIFANVERFYRGEPLLNQAF